MRSLVKVAVLPVALGVLALVLSAAPRAVADPPVDVTGSYAGKILHKSYTLVEGEPPVGGNFPATASVTLTDTMVGIMVTVATTDGDESYNLQGQYGLGRFWAVGSGPRGQMSVNGTVKGVPGKLKFAGTGSITSPAALHALKIGLKQQAPPL